MNADSLLSSLVWSPRSPVLRLQAAVKSTHISKAHPRALLFSLREALVLAHIPAHANVPPLLDFTRSKHETHSVIALAPGQELFEYISSKPEGKLMESEARKIVAGILEALRHVHASSVLHADLKLDNVLYDPTTGQVSLIDFGLSNFFQEHVALDEAVGCVNYASPALLALTNRETPMFPCRGHPDLWALGVLTHGLLTGYFPFRSEDPIHLEREIWRIDPTTMVLEDCSDLAHSFLSTLLNPANQGHLTALTLLSHPWIAPFAPPKQGKLPESPAAPSLPCSRNDIKTAVKAAELAVISVLPEYLSDLSSAAHAGYGLHRDLEKEEDLEEMEMDELIMGIHRASSESSELTLRGSTPVLIPGKGRGYEEFEASTLVV